MDMKLEVVPLPVRDIDAAKDFYTRPVPACGWSR
jgi:catechol 2,3-dioxygenase-like lactoylglutathione lyase family enzyme